MADMEVCEGVRTLLSPGLVCWRVGVSRRGLAPGREQSAHVHIPEILKPERIKPQTHKPELIKSEKEIFKVEKEFHKPEKEILKVEKEVAKPEKELLKPEKELLKPEKEFFKPELTKPEFTKPEKETGLGDPVEQIAQRVVQLMKQQGLAK